MRRRALALASVTMLSVVAFAPASSALPSGEPTERIAAQNIKWYPCFNQSPDPAYPEYTRLECADVKAPLDWKKPNGKKITLSISRLKARKQAKGVVFTNPGGPGEPGWTLPLVFIDANRTRMLDYMDIIGIDVRGTGYSTQASCKPVYGSFPDSRNRSAAGIKALLSWGKKRAKACQQSGNTKLPSKYVTTAQTVYDLEWIRRNLKTSRGQKVKKINWVGYSGGTWLGAFYARKWPKATGRFVLDSVVNFASNWQTQFDLQPKAFQGRFQTFARWAAKYNATFGLGTTQQAVVAKYEKMRAAIVKAGWLEITYEDGTTGYFYAGDLDSTITSSLYSKHSFIELARFLGNVDAAVGGGQAARQAKALKAPKVAVDPSAGSDATFDNITCNDTAATRTPSQLAAWAGRTGKKYPLTGYGRITDPCVHWKRASGQLKLPRPVGGGLPKVLLIQTVGDPATPYSGALKAHKAYKNSRLITVKNEGDHAVYAGDNTCVDTLVEKYLIDGVFPSKDRTCPGAPLPTPLGNGDARMQTGPVNPVLRAEELAELARG